MINKEEYLKAKQIVQEYEKQLNISDVSGSVFKFVIHKPSGKIGHYNEKTNRFREDNNYFNVTPKTAINCDSFEVHYR